ncbi:unnamed protein product [Cylindrotheca closterium]|uniref:Uncharacterized protein n=1 Tax=Cylindrotheca closterium TaxID=2856 RepID=A0AAD2G9B7_9STRA|nr:unnamed protein product [Cylindrotheca closterium]
MTSQRNEVYKFDYDTHEVPNNVTQDQVDLDIVPMKVGRKADANYLMAPLLKLERFERQVLQHCFSLQELQLSPHTMKLGIRCFDGCQKLVVADLSECDVWVLMTGCFRNCTSLELVHLPRTLEIIALDSFRGCESLKEVSLDRTQLRIIGKRALSRCSSLQTVKIPPCTKQVGQLAFSGCTALTLVEVPSSLNIDQYDVFKNCPRLQRILPYRAQEEEIVFYESDDEVISGSHGSLVRRRCERNGPPHLSFRARSDSCQSLESAVEEEASSTLQAQASRFNRALDEAKQENVALSQRLNNVCDKLEKYESQWSTMVEQLNNFASLDAMKSHRSEQERQLQWQLETYKGMVESQNQRIWEMKREHLAAKEAAGTIIVDQRDNQDCASTDRARGNEISSQAEPDRMGSFNVQWSRQPLESASLFRTDDQDESEGQARVAERTTPVPIITDGDTISVATADLALALGGLAEPEPYRVHQGTVSVENIDLLVTQTQESEESDEWQVM